MSWVYRLKNPVTNTFTKPSRPPVAGTRTRWPRWVIGGRPWQARGPAGRGGWSAAARGRDADPLAAGGGRRPPVAGTRTRWPRWVVGGRPWQGRGPAGRGG